MEEFNKTLFDEPLAYFDNTFMNSNKVFWTPSIFDNTNDMLVERICIRLYHFVRETHIAKLYRYIDSSAVNFKEFKEMCEFPAHWENQRHVEIDIWVCGYFKKNLMQMLCDQFDIIDNMLIGLDFECIF